MGQEVFSGAQCAEPKVRPGFQFRLVAGTVQELSWSPPGWESDLVSLESPAAPPSWCLCGKPAGLPNVVLAPNCYHQASELCPACGQTLGP